MECEKVVRKWADAPPTILEREAMMQRVLRLHVAAMKLRRRGHA
jgi:hypothetical protein